MSEAQPPDRPPPQVLVMAKLSLVQGMEIPAASAKGWASPPTMAPKRGLRSAETSEALWEFQWEGPMDPLWDLQWESPMAAAMD